MPLDVFFLLQAHRFVYTIAKCMATVSEQPYCEEILQDNMRIINKIIHRKHLLLFHAVHLFRSFRSQTHEVCLYRGWL